MTLAEMPDALKNWWSGVSWFELLGVPSNLACVWLFGRESIWSWPVGIVGILLFMVMFYDARLYSDVVLQFVFLILSIIGWYEWLRGGPRRGARRIERGVSAASFPVFFLIAGSVMGGAGYYFATYTDAALPYWDSSILGLSLVAQWLLNRKAIESWLFWIAVDVLAVGVYAYRGLYLTSVLYFIFLVLATRGFLQWRKKLMKTREAPVAETSQVSAA